MIPPFHVVSLLLLSCSDFSFATKIFTTSFALPREQALLDKKKLFCIII